MRKIITIDSEKCDGCEQCVDACAEGAIEMREGKAVLVADVLCDGFGDCLGECPTGALVIEEREVVDFDPDATRQHLRKTAGEEAVRRFEQAHERHEQAAGPAPSPQPPAGGCPGTLAREMKRPAPAAAQTANAGPAGGSQLQNWPIQLHLVSPSLPALREADLLVAADCTAFSLGSFHSDMLRGKALVIACPKLDETGGYVEKLSQMIRENNLASLTVARMEVPCCSGLTRLVEQARQDSGVNMPIREIIIGIQDGEILSKKVV